MDGTDRETFMREINIRNKLDRQPMAIQSIGGNVLITESNDVGMSSTSKLSVRCFCSNHIELLICKKGGW